MNNLDKIIYELEIAEDYRDYPAKFIAAEKKAIDKLREFADANPDDELRYVPRWALERIGRAPKPAARPKFMDRADSHYSMAAQGMD